MWLKLKPTPKGDFCVVRVRACFVNFSMHSTRRQNNIIPFHPKCPKQDQNLQFTPQSETTSFSVTFIQELPPGDDAHLDIHTSPTYEMTPGFKPFTVSVSLLSLNESMQGLNYNKRHRLNTAT